MLQKKIKYVDYDGVEREETFYFNLNKAELMEMELSVEGGLKNKLEKIIDTKDIPSIQKYFKEIILKAYGVKSDDGKRFIKSKQLSEEFSQTEAYSELVMELLEDPNKSAAFVNAIVPKTDNTPKEIPTK